jgi:hypothetical protein
MSLFMMAEAICGGCGGTREVSRAASVNADRREDLRQAILDGSFQAETCVECGCAMRLPAQLSYLDIGRGQWILAADSTEVERWPEFENNAQAMFDSTYGIAAPALARELGARLVPRLVFGWPALQEKLRCHALGLDDVTLEMLKLAIMRDVPGSPLADDTEFRLIGGGENELAMAWLRPSTETGLANLCVGRDVYDAIAKSPAWSDLRATMAGGLFVDMRRMFSGP